MKSDVAVTLLLLNAKIVIPSPLSNTLSLPLLLLCRFEVQPDLLLTMPDPAVEGLWRYMGLPQLQKPPGFSGSVILLSDAHKKAMFEMLPGGATNEVTVEKLFHCTTKNANTEEFHQLCDGKGATISIFQSDTGYVFGGYNPSSWTSAREEQVKSLSLCLLFSYNHFS